MKIDCNIKINSFLKVISPFLEQGVNGFYMETQT